MHWKEIVTDSEIALFEAAGFGGSVTLGKRPALLVIDVTWGFIGREPKPILESIKTYPSSCGDRGWNALGKIETIIDEARARSVPVIYTAGVTAHADFHAGRWREKHPRTLKQPADAQDIVDSIRPQPGDLIIAKTKPSVFFGTPLIGWLIDHGVDTLIVTGCTTSGCVRASVIDSFSYGFATLVVEDGVFDRGETSHLVNLFDMHQKYADVKPSSEVIAYLRSVHVQDP